MSGWRDAVISGAMAGPALVGQMDTSALSEATRLSSPLEQSAAALVENVGQAVTEGVRGQAEGEEAAGAEQVPEPEYGEYRDAEDLGDVADGLEFESIDEFGINDATDASDLTEGGETGEQGWS